jgi:quercetin dioxygenase-like cupin family protein
MAGEKVNNQKIKTMSQLFPALITNLPEADVPIDGAKAYLSQGLKHQIVFMEFSRDIEVPEHSHGSQWGIVLEGKIELTIDGVKKEFVKGDRFFIAGNIKHSAKIHAGYTSMEFFDQADRYREKK